MSIEIFTDSAANLPRDKVDAMHFHVIPCSYELDGELFKSPLCPEDFDAHAFYDRLRAKAVARTSMTNMTDLAEAFETELVKGNDVLYISISAGISGTFNSACLAAAELREKYPNRRVEAFDSMGAGLGTGLLAMKAADYREEGLEMTPLLERLNGDCSGLCEYFTVDDLMHLKRGGRLSGIGAAVGTVLNIKPLLRGDETGKIVTFAKLRGRKKAIEAIVKEYKTKAVNPEKQRVAISHGDCPEDAQLLADMVCDVAVPGELIIAEHEPYTGIHVGPGMLSLFFIGAGR